MNYFDYLFKKFLENCDENMECKKCGFNGSVFNCEYEEAERTIICPNCGQNYRINDAKLFIAFKAN
jgi:uncharacterized protein YbaR (Trm112 family)